MPQLDISNRRFSIGKNVPMQDFQNGHTCRQEKHLPTTQLSQTTAGDFQLSTFYLTICYLSLLLLQFTMTPYRTQTSSVLTGSTLSKIKLRRSRCASSREVGYDRALDWLIALLVIQRASHAS